MGFVAFVPQFGLRTLRFRPNRSATAPLPLDRNLRDLRPPLLHVREEDARPYLEAESSARVSSYSPCITCASIRSMLSVLREGAGIAGSL